MTEWRKSTPPKVPSQVSQASEDIEELRTGNARVDASTSALNLDLGIASDVREDITLPKLNECQFSVVGVSRVVYLMLANLPESQWVTKGMPRLPNAEEDCKEMESIQVPVQRLGTKSSTAFSFITH